MSYTFDSRGKKGAILPLQHRHYDKPPHSGEPWKLELRVSVLGCRVLDRKKGDGELGHYIYGEKEVGDITGALLWPGEKAGKPDARAQGAFSWVFPAETLPEGDSDGKGETFGRGGDIAVKVLRKPWVRDTRMATLRTDVHPRMNLPPGGSMGLVVQFQEESNQFECFVSPHTQAAIIAPWRGGKYENGTIVYDLGSKGELDPLKNGRIQHLLRVTHSDGAWQPAISLMPTAKKQPGGHGLCYGPGDGTITGPAGGGGVAAWLSYARKGPLHPGHGTADKHRAGTNAEGEAEQPMHLQHQFLIYENKIKDGPLNITSFTEGIFSGVPTKVKFDFNIPAGKWDWWTKTPVIPVPDIPWRPFNPPTDKLRPGTQVVGGGNNGGGGGGVTGGGGGGGGTPNHGEPVSQKYWTGDPNALHQNPDGSRGNQVGQPGPGTATNPAKPTNPALHENELGVLSLMIIGTRDRDSQGGQAPYGGTGADTEFPPPGFDQNVPDPDPSAPIDFSDPRIPIPPGFLSGGSGQTTTPIPVPQPADPFAGEKDIGPDNEFRRRGQRSAESAAAGNPQGLTGPVSALKAIAGRVGYLSTAGQRRGGPAPLGAHFYFLPDVTVGPTRTDGNGSGRWKYQQQPGTAPYGQGTAYAGALFIAPPVIPDGKDSQSQIGALDVLLYNGNKGGTGVRRFGYGQYNQQTGLWGNGWVFEPVGSSGSYNVRLTFKDNSTTPADRQGTLQLRGSLTVLGAGNVGALSGPFANGYFTATTVTTRTFTPQASSPGNNSLWVKTGTPTELWFTDSAGTETQIV